MARSPESWWPTEAQRAAATIPARWDDVVEVDGVEIPRAFAVHHSMAFEASIVEMMGPYGPTHGSMAGWFTCGCGWQASPPYTDPWDPRGEPVWTGEGWMAFYRHLPRGMFAFHEALRRWWQDHPGQSVRTGWALGDFPDDGRYRWWLWQVDIGATDVVLTDG